MNVIYSGLYDTVEKLNQHSIYQSQTIKIMEIMELVETASSESKRKEIHLL